MSLSPGQVLFDRYRVVKQLGRGEAGAVYRSWDMDKNIPLILEEILESSGMTQPQFAQLASRLAQIHHPSLSRVFHAFSIPGEGHYLVMEFIEGENLQTLLERAGGPLPETQVLEWIAQLCAGLNALHSQTPPIIHGAVKPSNIRLHQHEKSDQDEIPSREMGQVKLVSFRRAEEVGVEPGISSPERELDPGYSAPEMYPGRVADTRADIYALGATAYTLLTGVRPPESALILGKDEPPPEPVSQLNPAVDPGVSEAIQRAMQLDPAGRFDSVLAFQKALTPTLAPESPPAPLPVESAAEKPAQIRRPSRRWPFIVGGIAMIVVILAGLFLVGKPAIGLIAARLATPTFSPPPPTLTNTSAPTQKPTSPPPTATASPTILPSPSPTTFQTQIEDDFGVPMVYIPAGSFIMGIEFMAPEESPEHRVTLDAYYIDLHEATNGNYAECVQAGSCQPPTNTGSPTRSTYYGNSAYDNYPVIYVTWSMAADYCEWRGARLPTEAEWEKAARDEDGRMYPWGENINCTLANVWDTNSFCPGDTTAVGSYPDGASPYGLMDMAGNVWEWVMDWYDETYYASSPADNPTGPASGYLRVMRGGSWSGGVLQARVVTRGRNLPTKSYDYVGFRCVKPAQ
jgi:formylglycine-generating enzyme required for sulfatase activity